MSYNTIIPDTLDTEFLASLKLRFDQELYYSFLDYRRIICIDHADQRAQFANDIAEYYRQNEISSYLKYPHFYGMVSAALLQMKKSKKSQVIQISYYLNQFYLAYF